MRLGAIRPHSAVSMILEPIEEMRDYREDDLTGRRLFVTGLPSSIDDVRLYLAFEGFGRVTEAHVAKPGLGFVVFDDAPTADEALTAMEGTEISGKEIKVKRARSFYIRKEEEARLRQQSQERKREDQTKMFANEQMRRLREAEEQSFLKSQGEGQGLAHHLQNFDARTHRKVIADEMEKEGLAPILRGNLGDSDSVTRTRLGRVRMRTARHGLEAKRVQAAEQQPGSEQVLVGAEAEAEMRRRVLAARRRTAPELSLDSVLAPGSDGRTLSAKDEERIRKQAMIEIMKEGDKLSKTASKNLRPEDINIAHLIRQRVEQIRRYEMLRDNKELLEQITFTTSNPTSRCIDSDDEEEEKAVQVPGDKFSRARDAEWNVDDNEDDITVTETEEELIALISGQTKIKDEMLMKGIKFGDDNNGRLSTVAVAAAGAYQQNGVMRDSISENGVSTSPGSISDDAPVKKGRGRPRKPADEKKGYVPTGKPRGRPRKEAS